MLITLERSTNCQKPQSEAHGDTLRGLNRVLNSFCVTNHALCVFHSAPGCSSSICRLLVSYSFLYTVGSELTSNLLKKLGTNL
jgi:hypothetical protein